MSSEPEGPAVRFEPLRPAPRGQLVLAFALGPLFWLAALIVAAWAFGHTSAIAFGLLVAVVSFLISLLALAVVYSARRRQEKRYADGR